MPIRTSLPPSFPTLRVEESTGHSAPGACCRTSSWPCTLAWCPHCPMRGAGRVPCCVHIVNGEAGPQWGRSQSQDYRALGPHTFVSHLKCAVRSPCPL